MKMTTTAKTIVKASAMILIAMIKASMTKHENDNNDDEIDSNNICNVDFRTAIVMIMRAMAIS